VGVGGVGSLALLPTDVWWIVLFVVVAALWCVREGFRAYHARRWGGLLTSIILTWVVLKLMIVHLSNPIRDGLIAVRPPDIPALQSLVKTTDREPRSPRARALLLVRSVPAGHTLYVTSWYKDEGIAFYYGRPTVRLADWKALPVGREPAYAVVTPAECEAIERRSDWQVSYKLPMRDQQGDPMILVGVTWSDPPVLQARR
jgi:hypothetical protein